MDMLHRLSRIPQSNVLKCCVTKTNGCCHNFCSEILQQLHLCRVALEYLTTEIMVTIVVFGHAAFEAMTH
jgi:hypothetical protein